MTKPVSDATQLSSLDAIIGALRRGILPTKSECGYHADVLGNVRDRVAASKLHNDRKAAETARRGDIASVYASEVKR